MPHQNIPSPDAIRKAVDLFATLKCRFDDEDSYLVACRALASAIDVPAVATGLEWKAEPNRIAAYSGAVAIGAIYPSPGNRFVRWRVWVSCAIHPQEGGARSDTAARAEVEKRFAEFVAKAGLQRRPQSQS